VAIKHLRAAFFKIFVERGAIVAGTSALALCPISDPARAKFGAPEAGTDVSHEREKK